MFVIRGVLPPGRPPETAESGRWWTPAEARQAAREREQVGTNLPSPHGRRCSFPHHCSDPWLSAQERQRGGTRLESLLDLAVRERKLRQTGSTNAEVGSVAAAAPGTGAHEEEVVENEEDEEEEQLRRAIEASLEDQRMHDRMSGAVNAGAAAAAACAGEPSVLGRGGSRALPFGIEPSGASSIRQPEVQGQRPAPRHLGEEEEEVEEEDLALAAAIAASLQDVPLHQVGTGVDCGERQRVLGPAPEPEPDAPGAIELVIQPARPGMPRLQRRFLLGNTASDVLGVARASGLTWATRLLVATPPHRVLVSRFAASLPRTLVRLSGCAPSRCTCRQPNF